MFILIKKIESGSKDMESWAERSGTGVKGDILKGICKVE